MSPQKLDVGVKRWIFEVFKNGSKRFYLIEGGIPENDGRYPLEKVTLKK
ncbi:MULTISPECIES: hypothetical protein [Heyndrickxia]|jgi:hypothetical protein|uniref:Uncharacterized protein n=1 Tax=Heyndrickxia faecalis TaxID=2824910 RepID=A0AAU7WEX3_9BACI|nr:MULTISPECIES: hypothetical protein [Heyndrickxia]UXC23422.1 hypothetical protein N4P52_05225 [Heyndrickxia coagulans]